jgi:dethiobiotin synthetase
MVAAASRVFFIAGTDTDVGKTVVAAGLLRALGRAGRTTVGLKPVAAGCERVGGELVNSDAVALQRESSRRLDYAEVNPVALEPGIAPHLAAAQVNLSLRCEQLVRHCDPWMDLIRKQELDVLVIEGAGGWLLPLNDRETLADFCEALAAEVILVVGMRLGCLNHALLTVAEVEARGLRLAGWVANCLPPRMAELDANIATLARRISAPCLARVPSGEVGERVEIASVHLDVEKLLEPPA